MKKMARLDKQELKLIIKECLIEILAEGLAPEPSAPRQASSKKKRMNEAFSKKKSQQRELRSIRRQSHLDNIRVSGDSVEKRKPAPRRSIKKESLQKITSDPLMQDILSDTASTTLVAQGATNAKVPQNPAAGGDRAAQIVDQNDPTELFAESAQNWATLAFS